MGKRLRIFILNVELNQFNKLRKLQSNFWILHESNPVLAFYDYRQKILKSLLN
jgi:hypothetical protein